MKKGMFISFILLFICGCSSSTQSKTNIVLTISAAASMTDSLLEIEEKFTHQYPNIEIDFNFGGSGSLRKQIEHGAPVDLFFSASKADYDILVEQQIIEVGTYIFKNNLVFITSMGSLVTSFDDFLKQDKIVAIGTPEAVPAGTYAKETLNKLGVWKELQERIVFTKDVTQVVTYVREGAVEAGIAYGSDIHGLKDVILLETFNEELHSTIEYFAGMIKDKEQSENHEEAKDLFYQFIQQDVAQEVFQNYGFDTER